MTLTFKKSLGIFLFLKLKFQFIFFILKSG